jgi:hypothetical protein
LRTVEHIDWVETKAERLIIKKKKIQTILVMAEGEVQPESGTQASVLKLHKREG